MGSTKHLVDLDVDGTVESTGFIKTSGTSSQFLKADGSVDSSVYLTTQTDTQDLSISGHTISLTNGGSVTVPDNNTQRTNSEIDARIALNPEGFIDSYTDTNTQLSDGDIAAMGYIKTESDTQDLSISGQTLSLTNGGSVTLPDLNTHRAISSSPTNGATTTSISSDWAFDNVKTAVPSGAVFTDTNTNTQLSQAQVGTYATSEGFIKTYTDTNTHRAIHDSPVDAATTISISSNWAFDNVKTAVPSGALFTDTNTNTQLTSGQITAMGFSTTDNDTTYVSSDFTHDNLTGFVANEHLDWTTDRGATNIHANNYTNTNTQLTSGQITAMGFSTTDNDTTYSSGDFTHNSLSGVSANEHLDWTTDRGATNIHANNYANDNTQLNSAQITAMGFSTTDNDTTYTSSDFTHDSLSGVTANEHIDWTADQGATNIHSGNYTNTNTQLSDANIAAMGYIKTETDSQTLSISGHTVSLTNGGSVTVPDNNDNTQLSSADITAMGFSTTDNNTQLSEAEITAMGFTQSAGTVGGNGAVNRLPKFSTGGTNVENSSITDNGSSVFLGDGSLTLNDATFNLIKYSGSGEITGSSDGVHNLSLGSATIDWNNITMNGNNLIFKSENVTKFDVDASGNATAVGTIDASNLSGTNTGNNAVNTLYSGLVSDVNHNVTTNLTTTHNASTVVVNSSDGTNATINAATATTAGIMSEAIYDQHVLNNAKVTNSNTAWNALTGNQDDISLSEFDDDLGVLTSLSGAVLTTGTQSIAGNKTFTGTTKFGTFGNLDMTLDKGMQFELGTTAMNTMRTDADAFRIYMGGTTGVGTVYEVSQLGEHQWDGSGGGTRMKLDVSGNLHCDGDVTAYSTSVSDISMKDNVETIENATETVKQLRGVSYTWNKGHRKGLSEIGVIAQEVEKILPDLVHDKELLDGSPVKTVDYQKIIGLLIESNKELSDRLDKLEK